MILHELGGVPNLGSDELNDARDTAVTLELTNRFANVRGELSTLLSRATDLMAICRPSGR